MNHILFPENIPSGNKDAAAILFGMLETFKIIKEDVQVSLFSLNFKTDIARYGTRVKIIDVNGSCQSV